MIASEPVNFLAMQSSRLIAGVNTDLCDHTCG